MRAQLLLILFAIATGITTWLLLRPEPDASELMAEYTFGSKKSERMIVFGLDGVPAGLFQILARSGKYPNLKRLIEDGRFMRIRPEANTSAEIWTTYFTGRPPVEHGLTGFYAVDGSEMRLHNRSDVRTSFIWDRLRENGYTIGVSGFFGLYPVQAVPGSFVVSLRAMNYDELVRSTFARAHDSAYSFVTDKTPNLDFRIRPAEGAVFPQKLQTLFSTPCSTDDLNQWFRHTGFDLMVSALQDSYGKGGSVGPGAKTGSKASKTAKAAHSKSNVREMTKSLCLLIRNEQWLEHAVRSEVRPDFFAAYFLGMDFVIHRVFDFAPRFHRSEAKFILSGGKKGRGLLTNEVMRYIDGWAGRMHAELDADGTLVIVSDHGFHPAAVGKLHAGYLTARQSDADGFILVAGPPKAGRALDRARHESASNKGNVGAGNKGPQAAEDYLAPSGVYDFFRRYYGLAK